MRNPFRIRASQRSVSDEEFVKLFGAGALDLLETVTDPWNGLVFLRSAPGGGKTTFLRLLTPRPLQLTSRLVDSPQVKETHDALRQVGAIGDAGPELLGVMVAFTNEYRDLAEFDRGNALFRALLNSRIVIATLRGVLDSAERSFPDDLDKISFAWQPESDATIPARGTGRDLFHWASEIERNFYERMDDLGEPDKPSGGHARLDGLKWFAHVEITGPRGLVIAKRILLLDELQTLSASQRTSLTQFVTNAREACGIWIAERLEALTHRDLLSVGALQDRDYHGVIQLERQWSGKRFRTYAKFVEQIARLRAAKADNFEDRDFFSFVADQDDPEATDAAFEAMSLKIEQRIIESTRRSVRYGGWIEAARQVRGAPAERAVRWKTTEILVARDQAKNQASFDFDALDDDEFKKREKGVERASEHLLRSEAKTPVYFGRDVLAAVSSSNVDQYLEVAGELFEEVSAKIRGPRDTPAPLSPERQDAIIRQVAQSRWDGLIRRLPRGYEARRLLEAIGGFCRAQTFRPTAPYAPGVTGIAITMQDRKTLIDSPDEKVKHLIGLRGVLTSLVAHNLLIPVLEHQNSGRSYVVFNLNRLLCVQFGLPLGHGGWRAKTLNELIDWMENGTSQPDLLGEEAGLV